MTLVDFGGCVEAHPHARARVGWGGEGVWIGEQRGGGVGPLGLLPRPRRAAPARRPVSLRRVLSRTLRRLLPIATSCSLACVPPVWPCLCLHPPLPSCVPHVAPAPPPAVVSARPEAATASSGTAHLQAPPPSPLRLSAVRDMAARRLPDRSPCHNEGFYCADLILS